MPVSTTRRLASTSEQPRATVARLTATGEGLGSLEGANHVYHRLVVYAQPLQWSSVLYIVVLVLILLPLAMFLFRRASAEMVDVL